MKPGFLIILFCSFISVGFGYGRCVENIQDTLSAKDSTQEILEPAQDFLSYKDSININKKDSQALNLNEIFRPYKSFIKNTSVESTTNLDVKQQNISYKTKADFATRYTLNGILPDSYKFNVSIIKLNTKVETMGLQLQYNSQDSAQADTTSGFAKPLFDIVGKDIRLDVDTTGKILSVDTTDAGKNINNILSSLFITGGNYKVGNNFGLLYSKNADSLQLGSTWTDSSETKEGKTISKYIVQSMLHNEIILLVQGNIVQSGTFWSNGHAFQTDFTGTQSGKIIIARDTRLIKQKTAVFNMHGTVHFSGQDIPATAVSRISENLNPS